MEKLRASTERMSIQLTNEQRKCEALTAQHRKVAQQKVALINEVKKLRRAIVEKDEKKSELLEKMSSDEQAFERAMDSVRKENVKLQRHHCAVMQRFQEMVASLSGCNSSIESFSDTMHNFSFEGLSESYAT